VFGKKPDMSGVGRSDLEDQIRQAHAPPRPCRIEPRPTPATVAVEPEIGLAPAARVAGLDDGVGMWSLEHVRPEALQSGASADVDELVVVHRRIISRNRPGRTVESPDDEQKEVRVVRRSILAVVLVLAAALSGCTNPSGGGSAAPAPADSPAAPAQPPGY
jgi:hypothetical protein